MTNVLEIRPAQREGARLVIGLAGVSGSGKTVTALMLAYGLANYDPSKIGFVDAENRRGSLNADVFINLKANPSKVPFLIGDLVAPFSPQRYIEAVHIFQQQKIEVLIIDSATHEWEGPGGCLEIAGADNKNWNRAKAEHKRFVNAALQCDMHIILCFRAREKVDMNYKEVEIDGRKVKKTVYDDIGLQPITEKNFMFEMTASLMMHEEGQKQTRLKCPQQLLAVVGRQEGYITPADGKALRDWVDGAKQLDPAIERFRNRLLSNTEGGLAHINECWSKTPVTVQTALGEGFHQQIVASATAYDKIKADAAEAEAMGSKTESTDTAAAIVAAAAKGKATAKKPAPAAETAAPVTETAAPTAPEPKPEPTVAKSPPPAEAKPAAAPAQAPAAAPAPVLTAPGPVQATLPTVAPAATTLEEPMF